MKNSLVTAMVLGLLAGAACKKTNDASPKPTPAKTQETPMTGKDKTPATTKDDGAGVTAGGIDHAADEGAQAMLASATGTVEVRRVGETTWTAAKADTKLYAGDQVRTADQSAASIMLADQSVMEVAETSTVAIASRDGSADPSSSAAVLAGMARFTVTPRTAGEGAFRVYTPTAVVLTKGTTYGVGVAATGAARVGVETGSVQVIGLAALDAQPVAVETASQVVIAADGKVGSSSVWATDDWGAWRDETDAKVDVGATITAHGTALADLDAALSASYAELQANADSAATFEASAAASADKNDSAGYSASLPDGAATIDASFALSGRIEALTWAYTSHAELATELWIRHPEAQAQWEVVAPRVDASVIWPKRYEITAIAYWEPLRTQYYVHHPVGRAHAALVGITVPQFYASVEPQPIDPMMVRAKVKGQIWMQPELSYKPSTRHVWIAAPQANWTANAKVVVAAPRAKVAWYVRPPTLKATAFVGAPIKAQWQSKLTVGAPQARAALAASWKIPVGMKIKVAAPDLDAAANARAHAKFDMNGKLDAKGAVDGKANAAGDAKAKISGKVDVQVPQVTVPSVDVKAKVGGAVNAGADVAADAKLKAEAAANAAANAAAEAKAKAAAAAKATVNAGADVKSKVTGAVDVKVKAPEVKPPAVKVDVKAKASGGFKLGH